MCVGALDSDTDLALLGRLLEQRQKMRREDDVTEMVDGHMTIDTLVSQLSSHDTSCGIEDESIDPIRALSDLSSDRCRLLPIAQIERHMLETLRLVLP